jgi:hypothetical protein
MWRDHAVVPRLHQDQWCTPFPPLSPTGSHKNPALPPAFPPDQKAPDLIIHLQLGDEFFFLSETRLLMEKGCIGITLL